MKEFRTGVSYYKTGLVTVKVNFPEDDVCCHWCKFIDKSFGIDRKECSLTKTIIYNEALVCSDCPLIFEEKENGTEI